MDFVLAQFGLASPLFLLVLLGYALVRWLGWPVSVEAGLSRLVFYVFFPAMLFRLMSRLSELPPVDLRLLVAFFGGCVLTFVIGRLVAWKGFGLEADAQSIFAMGGIFSNNVLLGLPIARLALGDAALPAVSMVVVFNALLLWTLAGASVEWARNGSLSRAGLLKMGRGLARNPVILGVFSGAAYGLTGWPLPALIDRPLEMMADGTAVLALITLGMGLAGYGDRSSLGQSVAISGVKLVVQPLVVWGLALLIGVPPLETRVAVLLASMAVGVNVYQMAREYGCLQGATAGSLLVSTALAAFTTPLMLALTA